MFTHYIVPQPQVSVSRMTDQEVTIGSHHILRCSVIVMTVDIPVRLQVKWSSPTSLSNETTYFLPGTEEQHARHYLTLEIESFKYTYSGVYTCTALMMATGNTSAIVEDGISSAALTLNASNGTYYVVYFIPILSVTIASIQHLKSISKWTTTLQLTSPFRALPTTVLPAL